MKTRLTVFQVDGVDYRLALQAFEGLFHHLLIGGVDHNRRFDLLSQDVEERRHIGHFVPVRVLEAHVQDMGAVAHLPSAHLGSLFKGP